MPFKRTKGGSRGRVYKSPSGRKFSKKQVGAYYAKYGTSKKTRNRQKRTGK